MLLLAYRGTLFLLEISAKFKMSMSVGYRKRPIFCRAWFFVCTHHNNLQRNAAKVFFCCVFRYASFVRHVLCAEQLSSWADWRRFGVYSSRARWLLLNACRRIMKTVHTAARVLDGGNQPALRCRTGHQSVRQILITFWQQLPSRPSTSKNAGAAVQQPTSIHLLVWWLAAPWPPVSLTQLHLSSVKRRSTSNSTQTIAHITLGPAPCSRRLSVGGRSFHPSARSFDGLTLRTSFSDRFSVVSSTRSLVSHSSIKTEL